MENYETVYGFKQEIRNRYNTNHDVSEWLYIGDNQEIESDDNQNYLEFISTDYNPHAYIWIKKALHKDQKEAIVLNMDNTILQNKYLKFGLISKNVISNINEYEQLKILQFINIKNMFCLDFYDKNLKIDKDFKDIVDIVSKIIINDVVDEIGEDEVADEIIDSVIADEEMIYEFPSNSTQFYFMNSEDGIDVHYYSNKKWNSFNLEISIKGECFFFFEIVGLNNKIILKNIHQDTYLESEMI